MQGAAMSGPHSVNGTYDQVVFTARAVEHIYATAAKNANIERRRNMQRNFAPNHGRNNSVTAKETAEAQTDKLAHKFRTLMRYMTPPNAEIDGKKFTGHEFKSYTSQQLANFPMKPFMKQFEAHMAGWHDEVTGGGSASD